MMPVVLAAACRTPFAPAEGELAGWHPVDLAALLMNELVARAGVDPTTVDEVWVGCAEPVGAQGADMARAAVLAAGWPYGLGGAVVDRAETSGSAALHAAADAVSTGAIGSAVVVGVCSASTVPPGASALARTYGRPWGDAPARRVQEQGGLLPPPRAAERAAAAAGIDREAQDAAADRSHRRRRAERAAGIITVDARPGARVAVQKGAPIADDVHRPIAADPASLSPAFDADGTVTAMSFAPAVDGAAALLLTSAGDGAGELVATGRGAGDPLDPAGGVQRAVARAGIDPAAVDRWEVAETTAAGLLVVCDRLGIDPSAVNPDGGTLGVGDAGAAEELRLTVDGIDAAEDGELVVTVVAGPTGSAVTAWRRTTDDRGRP